MNFRRPGSLSRPLWFAAGALAAFAFAACGKKEESHVRPSGATAAVIAPATPLNHGDMAPDVELSLQDGRRVKLSDFRDRMVVLYFYPKDQTPGCTLEAESFRDHFEDLRKAGITVIGVSTQDAASHRSFIEKEKLPFDLAVDEDGSIAKAFGVHATLGGLHARQTFLLGKGGRIKEAWRDVKPRDHAAEVLRAAASS